MVIRINLLPKPKFFITKLKLVIIVLLLVLAISLVWTYFIYEYSNKSEHNGHNGHNINHENINIKPLPYKQHNQIGTININNNSWKICINKRHKIYLVNESSNQINALCSQTSKTLPTATEASPKTTEASPKATEASPKATKTSPKATKTSPKATKTSPKTIKKQIFIEAKVILTKYDLNSILGLKVNKQTITIPNDLLLSLELAALNAENKITMLAKPSLLLLDQETASIASGEEIPYVTKSRYHGELITFKSAQLKLQVTPKIIANDKIYLTIAINQEQPSLRQTQARGINITKLNTNVIVNNKQTIVLGGIYQQQINNHKEKFFHKQSADSQHEIVIFITAKIAD